MSRDRREDTGAYYPGGTVVPVAPQARTAVPVTDVGDLGDRYTLADVKAKVNQVVQVLAQRTSAFAILLSCACCLLSQPARADLAVQTARLDALYNDATVVTNVSGAATEPGVVSNIVESYGYATTGAVQTADSATLASAKAYTDASIAAGGSVTPQIVTNIVESHGYVVGGSAEWTNGVAAVVTNDVLSGGFTPWSPIPQKVSIYTVDQVAFDEDDGVWKAHESHYDEWLTSQSGDRNATELEFPLRLRGLYITVTRSAKSTGNALGLAYARDIPSGVSNIVTAAYIAERSTDSSTKRDLTNNVCAADSFTAWSATLPSAPNGDEWESQPTFDTDNSEWRWYYTAWYAESGNSNPNATNVTFSFTDDGVTTTFPATRAKAAFSNDTFTTCAFVTNAISGKADAAAVTALTTTSATHTATLSSHASQLSQLSQSNTQLASSVTAISAHLNAEDAHFVSTNYDSTVRTPEAYVEVKVDGTWLTIWKEMTRWTKFVGSAFDWDAWQGFHTWGTNVTANISALWDSKADRCWGIYDSETGGYSPDGVTQISSSNILIAANMAYQRTVTTDGAVWVLQCNNGHATLGGDTNGYFRIYDGTGTCQFEIIQGDQQELGADATGVTNDTSTSPNTLRINYSVVADEHPTLKICNDLVSANWKSETDSDCLANVTWTGTSGAYVAAVQPKTAQSKLFVTATYMSGGETYINNRAPVAMSSIYLNGTKYYLGTATIDGHTVLTLSTTAP